MKIKNTIEVVKEVFSKKRYITLAIISALLFYIANAMVSSYPTMRSYGFSLGLVGTIKIHYALIAGFVKTVSLTSLVTLIAISILFGIIVALISYKTRALKDAEPEKYSMITGIGLFIGVLAPGCAACGLGLLSVLGLSSAFLRFLPYKGTELSLIAIGLLLFSIIQISQSIKKGIVCQIIPPVKIIKKSKK
ncbi:MAG: hypothetical protein ACI83O_000002 [Patescibacteria group bacterium]|jgi:hypothetical protein